MRTNRNKTAEYKMVTHPRWQGGTVTNDRLVLEKKGIATPTIKGVYAIATHRDGKTQLWFRTPERLKAWKKSQTVNTKEFNINILQP